MTLLAFLCGVGTLALAQLAWHFGYPLVRRVLDRLDDRFRLRDICRDCTIRRAA